MNASCLLKGLFPGHRSKIARCSENVKLLCGCKGRNLLQQMMAAKSAEGKNVVNIKSFVLICKRGMNASCLLKGLIVVPGHRSKTFRCLVKSVKYGSTVWSRQPKFFYELCSKEVTKITFRTSYCSGIVPGHISKKSQIFRNMYVGNTLWQQRPK